MSSLLLQVGGPKESLLHPEVALQAVLSGSARVLETKVGSSGREEIISFVVAVYSSVCGCFSWHVCFCTTCVPGASRTWYQIPGTGVR